MTLIPGPDNTLIQQAIVQPFVEVDPTIAVYLVTSSFTVAPNPYNPYNYFYICSSSGAAITASLPISNGNAAFYFKKLDGGVNGVMILPVSASIDGGPSYTLSTQYQSVRVVSYNTASWLKY